MSRALAMIEPQDPTDAVGAMRKCIVTGEHAAPERMIRFVAGPEGDVVPDLARRLPGRGFWTMARRDVVEQAMAKRLFAKAARQAVKVGDDLADRIERLLLERTLEDLSRARRAGRAVAGFVRVEQMLGHGKAGMLIVAMEADGDGLSKLRATGLPIERLADAPALGRVFGRDQAVYVAIARDDAGGQFVRRISEGAARWRALRPVDASRQS